MHDGAGRGRAVLTGVDQRAGDGTVDRGLEVGVVQHDERRLAAELEMHPLRRGRSGFHHPPADAAGAGEGHHVDVGVRDQRLARDRTGAGHDVDHTGRDAGLRAGLGEHQRGQRGELARLQHDGVAGCDGRQDLPGRHLQWVVPRGDRPDDADRLPAYGGGVVRRVLTGRSALQGARSPGEEGRVVDRARDVELPGQPDRLAGLPGLGLGQRLGPLVEQDGQPVHRRRALARRAAAPLRLGGPRGRHRGIDVRRRRPAKPTAARWPFEGSTMSWVCPDDPGRAAPPIHW